jgi:LPS sulfotransferase NodH
MDKMNEDATLAAAKKIIARGIPAFREKRLEASVARISELIARGNLDSDEVQQRRAKSNEKREKLLKATGGQPKVSLICMTPRSGSTFFSAALRETGVLGNPAEWFNAHDGKSIDQNVERYGCQSREEILDYTYNFSATKNGIAVIKGDYFQCLPFIYDGLLEKQYGSVRYILLTRDDLLAQAISRYVGTVTNAWSSIQATETKKTDVPYDREGIEHQLNFLLDMEEGWRHFFASRGIKPARMTYEALTRNLQGKIQQAGRLLDVEVKVQPDPDKLPIQKQGSNRNKVWANRFVKETRGGFQIDNGIVTQ